MEIPSHVVESLRPLDRAEFLRLKEQEFRPHYDLQGLKYLRDRARHESNLKQLYVGRAPYELLQNADDVRATSAAFILSRGGFAFIHDGSWFTIANFRSLADGWSDKDPNRCIGHKGLGFRSVLDVTPSPFLIKIADADFFGVKFTWAINNGHIQKALEQDSSLRGHYDDWTKHGQSACPVMAIPGLAKKENLSDGAQVFDAVVRGRYGQGFSTMFWFPERDPEIASNVLRDLAPKPLTNGNRGPQVLRQFFTGEVTAILPLLASLKKVTLFDEERLIASVSRVTSGTGISGKVEVRAVVDGKDESLAFYQVRFQVPVPHQVRNAPDAPKALRAMDKVDLRLAVKLNAEQPIADSNARFHVYFPTEETIGAGFIVHGDFDVKPDRTRLMPGGYNRWLLGVAAEKTANEFLTALLAQYAPKDVYAALAPTDTHGTGNSEEFMALVSEALQSRRAPFIHTRDGLLGRDKAVLSPRPEDSEFWEERFSDLVPDERRFLSHDADGTATRRFLDLAQVEALKPESVLEFLQSPGAGNRPMAWWYDCYTYMANEPTVSRHERPYFQGKTIVPIAGSKLAAVSADSTPVICLPPSSLKGDLQVPPSFAGIFLFIDEGLAQHLLAGSDSVRAWVLNRFGIARFEASDLLPRAVRALVPEIFAGRCRISAVELQSVWVFSKRVVESSRAITEQEFWDEMGRLPVPRAPIQKRDASIPESDLVSAFLAYAPVSCLPQGSCLSGVTAPRQVDEGFFRDLVTESKMSKEEWLSFLANAGVSTAPKLLRYARLAVGPGDIVCEPTALRTVRDDRFTGERQRDENLVVLRVLDQEGRWGQVCQSVPRCQHLGQKYLQSASVIDLLSACVGKAAEEFQAGAEGWRDRLQALVAELPIASATEGVHDTAYCRGGGGHPLTMEGQLKRQLDQLPWLPTSHGPKARKESFVRMASRRLISAGVGEADLGDRLLPYVVVNNIDDLARLRRLGVDELDDVAATPPPVLARALKAIGEMMDSDWGRTEILAVKARWRLVRGALQEIYRYVNQFEGSLEWPAEVRLALRSCGKIRFGPRPWYFADSGSAVERAFDGILGLIDADRPYVRLFERMEVIRLIAGKTVTEKFEEADSAAAEHLRGEIVGGIAPYFFAVIVARSGRMKELEIVQRRLAERFDVRLAPRLAVTLSLPENPAIERIVEFPHCYLRRKIVQAAGAIEEAHYTLFVRGAPGKYLADVDAEALATALLPVFEPLVNEELAALFPRIAARYQKVEGRPEEMREYLHQQVGVSVEAQDAALELASGRTPEDEAIVPPPPPAIILTSPEPGAEPVAPGDLLKKHEDEVAAKAKDLFGALGKPNDTPEGRQTEPPGKTHETRKTHRRAPGISPEQRERGRKGEDELKRRLEFAGGWEGFELVKDARLDGDGYDFLCKTGSRVVKLEVKTFAADGRIIVTSTELREAANARRDYYLVGILDDGGPPYSWRMWVRQDPIERLLSCGQFDIEAKLDAQATAVFDL